MDVPIASYAIEWPMLWRIMITTYGLQQFAKISIFNVDNFVLPIFLLPKLISVAQIEWKKHPYYFFLLMVQK